MTDLPATAAPDDVDRQLPAGDEIFLDHVAHFVRDAAAASRALERAGFSTGYDLPALINTAKWMAEILGKPPSASVSRAGGFPA